MIKFQKFAINKNQQYQIKKAIECFSHLHQPDYSDIFSDFGQKEFAVDKLANITQIDDGFVILDEDINEKKKGTEVHLYASKTNIVEDYIPNNGKPKISQSEYKQG